MNTGRRTSGVGASGRRSSEVPTAGDRRASAALGGAGDTRRPSANASASAVSTTRRPSSMGGAQRRNSNDEEDDDDRPKRRNSRNATRHGDDGMAERRSNSRIGLPNRRHSNDDMDDDDDGGEKGLVGGAAALTRGALGGAGKLTMGLTGGALNLTRGSLNVTGAVTSGALKFTGGAMAKGFSKMRGAKQGDVMDTTDENTKYEKKPKRGSMTGADGNDEGGKTYNRLYSTESGESFDDDEQPEDSRDSTTKKDSTKYDKDDNKALATKKGGVQFSSTVANDAFVRRQRGKEAQKGSAYERIDTGILDKLPIEYRYNPRTATPVLIYLPRIMSAIAARETQEAIPLRSLLKAAQGDIRLHRARVQAALERDMKLIRTYQLENDQRYKDRVARLQERKDLVTELKNEKQQILEDLKDSAALAGLTQAESAQLQLARWQRALELYVYDTNRDEEDDDDDDYNNNNDKTKDSSAVMLLNWQSVFEKLLDGISEDQDISQILMQASEMCQKLVRETEKQVEDAAQYMADMESAYVIRLEAHEMFARSCLQQVANIEEQFRNAGSAALRIGHQLENAELKRSQCEAASILIRRWWIMESLAEQEAAAGEPIPVEMEMNGGIAPNACRLDHLFTKRENSLEASKALKQLRAVVRSRGNAAVGGSASTAGTAAMIIDKSGSKRLDLTSDLITRVSDALENRLLNQFSSIYNAGGNYDFGLKPRPGAVDWRELRNLAQALLLFDSGRNLHKRYVDMVLENRFPELHHDSKKNNQELLLLAESMKDENLNTFDMDATRTKLSTLFHRVTEVCTAEFELIAHVFTSPDSSRTDILDGNEEMPLVVSRALLQRVISDPQHGLQARVNDLLASIDRHGDFDSGAKKLDTFVIIHEKAAGLFSALRDASDRMMLPPDETVAGAADKADSALNAVESLKGFLTSQELALGNQHRQSYINLELRLLHHDCCACLDTAGCTLVKGPPPRPDKTLAEKGILEEYRAPILPLHKASLEKSGFAGILTKPLKPAVSRQPLIHATDALARARLMFGTGNRGGNETTARVILSIFNQMCFFYGEAYLYPILETLKEMLPASAPTQPPQLPFSEEGDAHDLGAPPAFWVALERIHTSAKNFDRELWSEGVRNQRVWDTLDECGDAVSLSFARSERSVFYSELERRGEAAILRALDTISTHAQWLFVTGGESMLASGQSRMLGAITGSSAGGPYAIPAGSSLDTPNSPAVKALTYCLRVQFVHIQGALTPHSLSNFWTALSMRMYDILVARLLQFYYISTVGAVILSRDVEALRSVAMLAGTEHAHWDSLRELLTLYMTPPDAIKVLLTGPSEGEWSKGLFAKAGKDKCIVFLSRRNDYRYKTTSGLKKSGWVIDMLNDLRVTDPTDSKINISLFAAGRKN